MVSSYCTLCSLGGFRLFVFLAIFMDFDDTLPISERYNSASAGRWSQLPTNLSSWVTSELSIKQMSVLLVPPHR
uniref:Uncharacterized protein n=1 Tax=Cucumis sativus TaxID=3659 RepID=A0A0A0KU75_CUCSA